MEHLRGACYGLRTKDLGLPTVWDSVDCISYLFEQAARDSRSVFGRLVTRLELGRTRRYEGWLVGQFDRVLVTSPVDGEALARLYQATRGQGDKETRGHGDKGMGCLSPPHPLTPSPHPLLTVLPNGVDLAYFTPTGEPREADTLVFSGKMSYHANVTAVLHLVEEIMPLVWAQRQQVRLIIAGKDPPRKVRALACRHWPLVGVTGTVPDIRPYLRRATVAVVPTPYGAGIQNKVLEAMACETPVVASAQAVSALQVTDGEEILVAGEPSGRAPRLSSAKSSGRGPAEFARRVLELLENEALRKRIGRRGREYVEKHHDWRRVAEQLERIYRDASGERGSHLGTD